MKLKSNAATTTRRAADLAVGDQHGVVDPVLLLRLLQPVARSGAGRGSAAGRAGASGSSMREQPSSNIVLSRPLLAASRMWWPQWGQTCRFRSSSRWKIICSQAGHLCQRLSGTSRGAPTSARIFGRAQFLRPVHACRSACLCRCLRAPRNARCERRDVVERRRGQGCLRRALVRRACSAHALDQGRADHRGVGDPRDVGGLLGVLMPKPTAIGRSVCLRRRGTAAADVDGGGRAARCR